MAIPQNIEELAHKVRTEIYGRDVREALATSMEATAEVAEWSREVAQQIIDGSFDEGELNTEIERKLNELEQQYAPRLTSIETEIEDARGYKPNLGDRLNEFSSQLAQKANTNELLRQDYIKYGKIELPSKFPPLHFDVYRDRDGVLKHNFNFDSLIGQTHLYVSDGGLDTDDGLTTQTPVRTVQKAVEIANTYGTGASVVINLMGFDENSLIIDQNTFTAGQPVNVTVPRLTIQPYDRDFLWVARSPSQASVEDDGGVYKITTSAVLRVFDLKYTDYRGMPSELVKMNTLAECKAKIGSYYTDGVSVWVNLIDRRQPELTQDLAIIRRFAGFTFNFYGTRLIMKNIGFISDQDGSPTHNVLFNGNDASQLWLKNVKSVGGDLNGIALKDVGLSYLFDVTSTKCGRDGLNYHGVGTEQATEFNCHAYDCGESGTGINNGSTAHDGMTIVRFDSVCYNTNGPVIADVNGCLSYLVDCNAYDSTRTPHDQKAAFWFSNEEATKDGEVYLVNCQGGGVDTFSLSSDGLIDVYVQNFRGNKINNTELNFIA